MVGYAGKIDFQGAFIKAGVDEQGGTWSTTEVKK